MSTHIMAPHPDITFSSATIPPITSIRAAALLFTAELSQTVAYSSMRVYLSAVHHFHLENGWGDPLQDTAQLHLLLRGAMRQKPPSNGQRLPVTPLILRMIRKELEKAPQQYKSLLQWAACGMEFYAFLRSGEFTGATRNAFDPTLHITPEFMAVDSREKPTTMKIHIKQSKTDQLRQGINLFIGVTDNNICPITAALSYLAARGSLPHPPSPDTYLVSDSLLLVHSCGTQCREESVGYVTDCVEGVFGGHAFNASTTSRRKGDF